MKELKIPHKQREHFKKSFLHNTSLLLFLNQDFKMESSIEYLKGKKWESITLDEQQDIFIFKAPEYQNTILLKQEQGSDDIDSLIFRIFTSTDKAVKTKQWYEKAKTMNENIYDVS